MFRLTGSQLAQLAELEKREYIREVRKNIVGDFPEYASDPGLEERLRGAYHYATSQGFVTGALITQFLHLEAFAPGFYRQPAIDAWLSKPGNDVEQRFADLTANLKSKMKEF